MLWPSKVKQPTTWHRTRWSEISTFANSFDPKTPTRPRQSQNIMTKNCDCDKTNGDETWQNSSEIFFSLIRKRTRNKFQRRKWKRDENVFFLKGNDSSVFWSIHFSLKRSFFLLSSFERKNEKDFFFTIVTKKRKHGD